MSTEKHNRPLSNEVKRHFLEIVSTYNKYQEMIERKSDMIEVCENLGGIIEAARELALRESDDWFDAHTIKRNMSELDKLGKQFDKLALEAKAMDQRLISLYEDMGSILSRYYKFGDISEDEMKRRLAIRESVKKKINESPNRRSSDFFDNSKHGQAIFKLLNGKWDSARVKKYLDSVGGGNDIKWLRILEFMATSLGINHRMYDNKPTGDLVYAIIDKMEELYKTHTESVKNKLSEKATPIQIATAKHINSLGDNGNDYGLVVRKASGNVRKYLIQIGEKGFRELLSNDDLESIIFGESVKKKMNEVKFKRFDDVRSKSKNLAGMIYKIQGNDVVINTRKGLIKTTIDDLELMPESVNEVTTTIMDFKGKTWQYPNLRKDDVVSFLKKRKMKQVGSKDELKTAMDFYVVESIVKESNASTKEAKEAQKINKAVKGQEIPFYDALEQFYNTKFKGNHAGYQQWLNKALEGYGIDAASLKNNAEKEESLYKASK